MGDFLRDVGRSVVNTFTTGLKGLRDFKEKISSRDQKVSKSGHEVIQTSSLTQESSIDSIKSHGHTEASKSLPDQPKKLATRVRNFVTHLNPFSKQKDAKSEALVDVEKRSLEQTLPHVDPFIEQVDPFIEQHVSLPPGSFANTTQANSLYQLLPQIKENTLNNVSFISDKPKTIQIRGFKALRRGEVISDKNLGKNYGQSAIIGYDKDQSKYYLEAPILIRGEMRACYDVELNGNKLTDKNPRLYLEDGNNSITFDGNDLFNIKLPW